MKSSLYKYIVSLLQLDRTKRYSILDIGCGHGELLAQVSKAVGSGSVLTGIDGMQASVDIASANYPAIDFRQEKFIDKLAFDDDSFDIVLSVDTLECIPDKDAFLSEIRRILKPGGKVLCAHWDWDTQVYNSDNKDIIRRFVSAFSDWEQDWMDAADGQMGRRLWGLFQQGDMYDGAIHSFTLLDTEYRQGRYGYDRLDDLSGLVEAGSLDAAEYETIRREMLAFADKGKYLYSVNSYIYVGILKN